MNRVFNPLSYFPHRVKEYLILQTFVLLCDTLGVTSWFKKKSLAPYIAIYKTLIIFAIELRGN